MTTATATLTADLLIDRGRLRDLLGAPVRATRLRHKPGLSTTAALLDDDGGVAGWAQVVTERHLDKLRNARRRATARGQDLTVTPVPGHDGVWVAHGPVTADPRLVRALDDLGALADLGGRIPDGWSVSGVLAARGTPHVLRYNPARRLVLRTPPTVGGGAVLRLTAARHPARHAALRHLREAGLPVVGPVDGAPSTARVTLTPWVGDGDLASHPGDAAARLAGATLARLHRAPAGTGHADHRAGAVARRLLALADDLGDLDEHLGRRARRLAAAVADRLQDGPEALVHGDFSADQVAVGADRVWLLDLDRLGVGDAGTDLGSFAAAELAGGRGPEHLLPVLLDGYAAAGGRVPADLAARTAAALMTRVLEPFRAGDPAWRDRVPERLDQIGEVLR